MVRIRIAHCCCRNGHIIAALGIPDPETPDAEALAAIHEAVGLLLSGTHPDNPHALSPWCGLCGSRYLDWEYALNWSPPFETLEEAREALEGFGVFQGMMSAIADMLGVTYDAERKRGMN